MKTNFIDKGFLKLSKHILDWQWYTNANVARLYIHILLKANFKHNLWQGHQIHPGEFITSLDKLHIELNLSVQEIRTALKKLQKTGYISIKPTNKFTLIRLLDSDVFNTEQKQSNKSFHNLTHDNQHTNNIQETLTNKDNSNKTYEERIEVFRSEVDKYKNEFSQKHLNAFFCFWTEKNVQTGRAKFEDEQYWNLSRRLSSWISFSSQSNAKKFIKNR